MSLKDMKCDTCGTYLEMVSWLKASYRCPLWYQHMIEEMTA